jgi:hypothetical protein
MHKQQGLYQVEQVFPERDYFFSSCRGCYLLEIIFESAFIGKLKDYVITISMSEASIETYHTLSFRSKQSKGPDFGCVVSFSVFAEVSFEHIGIRNSMIRRL